MQKLAFTSSASLGPLVLSRARKRAAPKMPKAMSAGPGDMPSMNASESCPRYSEYATVPPKVRAKPSTAAAIYSRRRSGLAGREYITCPSRV